MAQVYITVNGRKVEAWIDEEETQDIRKFYASEMQGFRKACHRPIVSKQGIKNVTRPVQAGNNSVRFA